MSDRAFEEQPGRPEAPPSGADGRNFVLRLYVTGMTPRSIRAIANLRNICESLENPYELEIIDLHEQPELARNDEIIAAPTLVKSLPLPIQRWIGDLSDSKRVLAGLRLEPKPK